MSRYKAYSEFKSSGTEWLGQIPSSWGVKRLGQFFEERREKVSDEDYPALSVTMQGIVPQLETAAKTDAGDNRKLVLKNDFVINSRSDRKGSSGVSNCDGSVSLISIVMTPRGIHPPFAHHLLRSYPFQEEFYRYGKGIVADLWSTNASEMRNILIPDISLSEQEKIAAFLDHETAKIDALIEKQHRLIELLKEKRQAVISHAVTKGLNPKAPMRASGVEWLGEVPAHWVILPVKYLSNTVGTGGTPKSELSFCDEEEICWFTPGDFSIQGKLVVSAKHITSSALGNGDAKLFKAGSVLVIGIGATLGKVAFCESNFSCNQQINVICPNSRVRTEFLMYSLLTQTEQMKQSSNFSTIGIMNQEKTKQILVAVPPLTEQSDICAYLEMQKEKFGALETFTKNQIQLLQERRTALISAAVTGKIDVRDWQAAAA